MNETPYSGARLNGAAFGEYLQCWSKFTLNNIAQYQHKRQIYNGSIFVEPTDIPNPNTEDLSEEMVEWVYWVSQSLGLGQIYDMVNVSIPFLDLKVPPPPPPPPPDN